MPVKLLSMGNDDKYSHFEFEKNQDLFPFLQKLLFMVNHKFVESAESMATENGKVRDVKSLTDVRFSFREDGIIDIIFGSEKVFVITYLDEKLSNSIRKYVSDNAKF